MNLKWVSKAFISIGKNLSEEEEKPPTATRAPMAMILEDNNLDADWQAVDDSGTFIRIQ